MFNSNYKNEQEAHLLVIGSPSFDTIHTKDQIFETLGGSGLYMPLAAIRCGVKVTLFGPRPHPVPKVLLPFSKLLHDWIGPFITPNDIPRFEISHNSSKAKYLKSSIEAETNIEINTLPKDLSVFNGVHITPMGNPKVQSDLMKLCRERGAKFISLGTWIYASDEKNRIVKKSIQDSDVFFMNEEEVTKIFGSIENVRVEAGKNLYITLADKGALVLQGNHRTQINASQTQFVDPTGAGETFCGATIANLLLGIHPIMAGQKGCMLAAKKLSNIGPTALLEDDDVPVIPLDNRIQINNKQVAKISEIVKNLPATHLHTFVSEYLPPIHHPNAVDYFFAVTLQQFGFWEDDGDKYTKPMVAKIDGKTLKGSSYLYYAFTRQLLKDPTFFTPERQAEITEQDLLLVFKADDGSNPMPRLDLHVQQANQYGRDMLALDLNPKRVLETAQNSAMPLKAFTMILDHIGGYKEDPLRKKLSLLALSLSQRPEKFFKLGENETVLPVIDYHCMRSCLRIGLIDIINQDLKNKVIGRKLLSYDEEWAIRFAAYRIQQQIECLSEKTIAVVDWFFFDYMRTHCPEMTEPNCTECSVNVICAHNKEMFQPVIRTLHY